jgi:hypothetical protein
MILRKNSIKSIWNPEKCPVIFHLKCPLGTSDFVWRKDEDNDTLKFQGVREYSCEILDGGKIAFEQRKNKYNIN